MGKPNRATPNHAIKAISHGEYQLVRKDFELWLNKDPRFFLEKLSGMFKSDSQTVLEFFYDEKGQTLLEESIRSLPTRSRNLTKAAARTIINRYKN